MDDQEALALFSTGDQEEARRAFEQLSKRSRPFLYAYLKRKFLTDDLKAEDRSDIVQTTLFKRWQARSSFQNRGLSAWYGMLKKMAFHSALDFISPHRRETLVEDEEAYTTDYPESDLENKILRNLSAAIMTNQLFDCADVLWLGLDRTIAPAIQARRVRAAYHFYLMGTSYEKILRLVPPLSPEDPPLTRVVLDEWLSDPCVLRTLAYHELFYSNDRLSCHLLDISTGCESALLDERLQQAREMCCANADTTNWEAMETAVILWRYRYALLTHQILQHEECAYTAEQLEELLGRLTERLPFNKIMANLCVKIGKAKNVLGKPSLWQRLAFQYRYVEELSHRDIQERTQPAAEQVAYDITLAKLNGWLSQGHLLQQLINAYAETYGDKHHGGTD